MLQEEEFKEESATRVLEEKNTQERELEEKKNSRLRRIPYVRGKPIPSPYTSLFFVFVFFLDSTCFHEEFYKVWYLDFKEKKNSTRREGLKSQQESAKKDLS